MKERYMKDYNGEKIYCLEYDKETLRDMICELQEELFAEKQRFNDYLKEQLDYKLVVEKAIKYCEESSLTLKSHYFMDVVNILTGEK